MAAGSIGKLPAWALSRMERSFHFLIRDISARDARAFPKGKPVTTDFQGVKRVVIAVRDLKSSIARYRQAYGFPAPVEHDDVELGAHLASFAGTPVIIAVPLKETSWIAQRIEKFGEGLCAFVLGGKGPANSTKISWLDAAKLGWRLGIEASEPRP